ncbi:hypothetical protein CVT26_011787 [Gymnopilus dilepis]|uniref:Uncharacterized protein n=1 Tax=Gymnopilus dilepis TaxID=231916 RepID=A0A409WNS2_9AGAR|nr:hypothetical protein CVT26_011787 [Gymnopilus dilepis]
MIKLTRAKMPREWRAWNIGNTMRQRSDKKSGMKSPNAQVWFNSKAKRTKDASEGSLKLFVFGRSKRQWVADLSSLQAL